jgi:hypothetical protein
LRGTSLAISKYINNSPTSHLNGRERQFPQKRGLDTSPNPISSRTQTVHFEDEIADILDNDGDNNQFWQSCLDQTAFKIVLLLQNLLY